MNYLHSTKPKWFLSDLQKSHIQTEKCTWWKILLKFVVNTGKKGGLNDKWFKMLTFQLKNELNKCSRALGERERKNGMLLCGLIAVEKTYIVSMYSEQCERQRPFLHVFFNVNYNYNFFLIQPVFFHSFHNFFFLLRFFFLFFSLLCERVCMAWHCACERLNERHVGTQCAYLLQHFHKMTRFYVTPLCKSVCSKRHHGKWKDEKKKSLNLCALQFTWFFLFNQIQYTPVFLFFVVFFFSSEEKRAKEIHTTLVRCSWKCEAIEIVAMRQPIDRQPKNSRQKMLHSINSFAI